MIMRSLLGFLIASFLAPGALRAGDLLVKNGDFGDLSGLTAFGGDGWLQGIPVGWKSTERTALYAVHAGADRKHMACNVSQLGTLWQQVGKLSRAADVVLTVDVGNDWGKGARLRAEIVDDDGEVLCTARLGAGRGQRLVAGRVPTDSAVTVRFQALEGTTPALDNVVVATYPPGTQPATPQIEITRFQPDKPLARALRPAPVSAELFVPRGPDLELMARLTLPPGVRVIRTNVAGPVHLGPAEGWARLTWDLEAATPMTSEIALDLVTADGRRVANQRLAVLFLPSMKVTNPPYIPEPVPVPTSMLVGAHNCPLWESDKPEMWRNVRNHPERMPALGLYSLEGPEAADWETKWAVEHGVSFFVYCWYRTSQGGAVKTQFGGAIHDALFKSRFGKQMKFTIMWENQARGVAGVADERDLFTNLLPYWMKNYFKQPNYLKVDNKPVLFIYRPEFLVQDLGGAANVARAFDRMRQACRDEGFDGLYILGEYRGTDSAQLALMKTLGLDYTFAYCWHVPDNPTPERAIRTQHENIQKTQDLHILPQVVTVSQAWSGWNDEGSIWKIPPRQFEVLLRKAKAFTATLPKDQLGSRMLLLDNWNEWGEGHYIAPYREYGFGYLDAVRNVFSADPGEHQDILPEDIGRGPYDVAARTHFESLDQKERLASKRVVKEGVPAGLVAWWTFDEPTDTPVAFDDSGHRNGGFLEKARRAPGFEGHALVCDGGSVVVPRSATLGSLQTFSLECRVKTDVAGQLNSWFLNSVFASATTSGFRLGVLGGKPCFQVPLTAWSHHLTGNEPLPVGKWVHLVATFDGSHMRLFMDGKECGSMSRPGPVLPTQGRLVLANFEVSHAAYFQGLLDDVRVYRRVLSPDEIRSNAGATSR